MHKTFLALAAPAALLAGCASMGGPAPMAGMDLTPAARTPYVMMAASSDLYEIQSGQMAQQKSRMAPVRQFGQMLVAHHQQTSQQLMAAARASGMNPPPPTLMPMHQRMLGELSRANGPAFDRMFRRQQVIAHQMALNLHRNYAQSGDSPPLRTAAAGAVPVVSQHLQQARQMR